MTLPRAAGDPHALMAGQLISVNDADGVAHCLSYDTIRTIKGLRLAVVVVARVWH